MKYADPPSFRRALEDRLKTHAKGDGAFVARNRKRVIFDRFLARLCAVAPGRWLLKGGFALDLRLAERARATKDIDLDWHDNADELLDTLLDAAVHDTGDYFTFTVERTGMPPDRLGGSHRFRIAGALAGREFDTFLLDVGQSGGPMGRSKPSPHLTYLPSQELEPVTVPALPWQSRSPRNCTPTPEPTTEDDPAPEPRTW